MYRTLYLKAEVQWELFCDLCGASKGWVQCRQRPISLSRLTTHARLGNETITNKFYRYILSNLKGNQKSKWKLCLRKALKKKKRKNERRKEMRKGFFFFFQSSFWTRHWKYWWNQKRHVGDTPHCWREKPTMERVGVLRKDDISNHLGNTGTVSVNDSLYCN